MLKKIIRWVFIVVVGFTAVLFLLGTGKQWYYDSSVKKEFQPTGKFSDIGYNKIHFKASGNTDLTFVLISGLGETMNTWTTCEKELQNRGQVFMYDRSGLGHSEEGILPRSVDNCATELHTVLTNENIKGPYILIGHSAGGFIARYYAKKYPEHILGLFLLDPYPGDVSKDETVKTPFVYRMMNWSLRNLSWSGIPYFLLPTPPHPVYKTSKAIKTYGQEAFAADISLREFAKLDTVVSNLPLFLLVADKPGKKYNDLQKEWHKRVFAKYSNTSNKLILVTSGHSIHVEQPEFVMKTLDEFLLKLNH